MRVKERPKRKYDQTIGPVQSEAQDLGHFPLCRKVQLPSKGKAECIQRFALLCTLGYLG